MEPVAWGAARDDSGGPGWGASWRWLALVSLALLLGACPRTDQSLVLVGGDTVDAATIDGDPLAVLPAGALLIGQLDARALFATSLGGHVGRIAQNVVPLGQESGFVPSRDVHRIYGATYAMQGADFCAVVQGNFDEAAIRRSAQAQVRTPSGVPLVQTQYGGNTLYTVANVGFVLLTPRTLLSGNETCMRRALDRLGRGKIERSLQPWMHELFDDEQADFVLVGDLTGQGVVEASAASFPFLAGLRLVRVLGNFREPGANVVGSLTYRDPASAAAAGQTIQRLRQVAAFASLLSMLGLAPAIPPITVAQQGHDIAFALAIDTSSAAMLLELLVQASQPGR